MSGRSIPLYSTLSFTEPSQPQLNFVGGKACLLNPPGVVYCAIRVVLPNFIKYRVRNFAYTVFEILPIYLLHTVTLLPPSRRLVPSVGLGSTWVRELQSDSCHYPTATNKCKKQSNQTKAKPCQWKSML